MIHITEYNNPPANEFVGAKFLELVMDSPELNALLQVQAEKNPNGPEARFLSMAADTGVITLRGPATHPV